MTEQRAIGRDAAAAAEAALRSALEGHLAQGRTAAAIQVARELLQAHPGVRSFRYLRTLLDKHAADGLKPVTVALLSSFSIEFVQDALVAQGFASGARVKVQLAGFDQATQQILDPASALYGAKPDLVVLALEGADLAPELYAGFTEDEAAGNAAIARVAARVGELARAFRGRSSAPLLIHNFALPAWRTLGIRDAKLAAGQARLVAALNDAVAALAREVAEVHVVDYAGLVNRVGAARWYDRRMQLYARAPLSQTAVAELAREYAKFVRAAAGLSKKCLVLDLDNTLWGGIIGEDGIDGIKLGPTYPGNAYAAFQRAVLDLRQRGVILAIASKNNPADVERVFAEHKSMLLKREHFAVAEIGWEAKSAALERIARSLNIGLDHLVFADDNPAEIEQVRRALPMVTVIALPSQPELFVDALMQDGWFDTLNVSAEDLRRGELYQQRAQAEALKTSSGSLEDYYRDLGMTLTIAGVAPGSLARAAQLTQKTNQFNTTTRRYSEAEVAKRSTDPAWVTGTVAVADRFGDNGIVGVLLAERRDGTLAIDSFLLSCRVIGRGVETAMLAHLCDQAKAQGLDALEGEIIPTTKNAPARDLFERHGFARVAEGPDGATRWRLDLSAKRVDWPDWFEVQGEGAA